MPREREGVDAAAIRRWLERFAALVDRDRDLLTELDAAIGDADHGLNMARGMAAVRERLGTAAPPADAPAGGPPAATSPATPASLCRDAAMTLISTVGGASGPLYGTFLLRLAAALPAAPEVGPAAFIASLHAGVDGVAARGRAAPGDKTMLDAMAPAVGALEAAVGPPTPGSATSWAAALRLGADAAARGSDATIPLVARRGRASYLGERSVGHRDPGAASSALLFAALAEALAPVASDRPGSAP